MIERGKWVQNFLVLPQGFRSFHTVFLQARWRNLVRVERLWISKPIVVDFCSIASWCYSGWWLWDLRTLAVSGKWNVSRVIPRLYGWVYKILRLPKLLVELWVPNQGSSQLVGSQSVVVTVGSQLGGTQFISYGSYKTYFQWLQLKHAIPRKWKTIIKQNPGNVSNLLIQDHHLIKGAKILTLEKLQKNYIQYW